jgi:hypothetical protein
MAVAGVAFRAAIIRAGEIMRLALLRESTNSWGRITGSESTV